MVSDVRVRGPVVPQAGRGRKEKRIRGRIHIAAIALLSMAPPSVVIAILLSSGMAWL
jgi:hypothetical protein